MNTALKERDLSRQAATALPEVVRPDLGETPPRLSTTSARLRAIKLTRLANKEAHIRSTIPSQSVFGSHEIGVLTNGYKLTMTINTSRASTDSSASPTNQSHGGAVFLPEPHHHANQTLSQTHAVQSSLRLPERMSDFSPIEYGLPSTEARLQATAEQPDSAFNIIRRRRSVGQVTQEQPTPAQIERLLEAATYAPSHHVTEPWRFFVLTGASREQLGSVMAESLRQKLETPLSPKAQGQVQREHGRPLRAPVIIIVAVPGASEVKGDPLENIEAAAAAVQNMLLAAEELGLASIWRTGSVVDDPAIKRWLGLSLDAQIIGFVYVGYPKVKRPMRVPTPFSAKTVWLS